MLGASLLVAYTRSVAEGTAYKRWTAVEIEVGKLCIERSMLAINTDSFPFKIFHKINKINQLKLLQMFSSIRAKPFADFL